MSGADGSQDTGVRVPNTRTGVFSARTPVSCGTLTYAGASTPVGALPSYSQMALTFSALALERSNS